MNQTIAVVFGTFAPMHKGHLDLIERAKLACGQVCVVVSGYDRDRGDRIGLDLTKRFQFAQEQFKEDDLVRVCALDETDLPAYPDGWDLWLERLLAPKAQAFQVYWQNDLVGGGVVQIDSATNRNSLDLLFVDGNHKGKGLGLTIWQAIE
ncbi:TPA: GNAT family N-acetyltransferase [Streptococcus suis]